MGDNTLKTPKMIIFDYAQTLVDEQPIDTCKGTEAVLKHAVSNPLNVSLEEAWKLSNELHFETILKKEKSTLEVHTHHFQNYLYEYLGIEFEKSSEDLERIFENASCKAESTKGIETILQFLDKSGIRTAVISNMSFSGNILTERIERYLPANKFEFIISSSEYVFRKPDKRIFELALRKARLAPHEVWYCGDDVMYDVQGAVNSGITPVLYRGAWKKVNLSIPKPNCLVIDDWSELINLIDQKIE